MSEKKITVVIDIQPGDLLDAGIPADWSLTKTVGVVLPGSSAGEPPVRKVDVANDCTILTTQTQVSLELKKGTGVVLSSAYDPNRQDVVLLASAARKAMRANEQ